MVDGLKKQLLAPPEFAFSEKGGVIPLAQQDVCFPASVERLAADLPSKQHVERSKQDVSQGFFAQLSCHSVATLELPCKVINGVEHKAVVLLRQERGTAPLWQW
ncbi:hypothetical protein C8263_17985 [Deinococcus arcticus]|uniref:Uncharacterized protein n=1 Tax=Deinococcus arcticus TaxID=2136176 RepID=A0A2T3W3G5_9DEIO|nr:hypothetical protein C8263_17985 [Deinococcus arcticus]